MQPVTLLVLDGWGVSPETRGNAVLAAKTPNYHILMDKFAHGLLAASGVEVGLPPGLMGNSEVGHLNIGAGRIVIQKLTQISQTIIDGTFFQNPALKLATDNAKKNRTALHLIGLVSDGCVHSSPDHLNALIDMAQREQITELVVHPILDGRDTPPRSALRFMRDLENKLVGKGVIGVVSGRYYAMDRDSRWDRLQKYWNALVLGQGLHAKSAIEAVQQGYDREENDEFVLPTVVTGRPIQNGDSVICFNFRPDRVRQVSRVLTQLDFNDFERPVVPNVTYVCMTQYDTSLNLPVAFTPDQLPPQDMANTLPELLACHHLPQLHVAETEKYAHVTYFFNGGKEAANELEERVMVPSLKVATYDKAPQMQTESVADVACKAITSGAYPFIVLNFANPDMVGHTGFMEAAVDAVKSVDIAFGQLLEATRAAKGTLLITADHGNVEQMIDLKTNEAHTAHTTNPVPFIVADFSGRVPPGTQIRSGSLADVAPTILEVMKIPKPKEMTGSSLLQH